MDDCRLAALSMALEQVRESCDVDDRLAVDPVGIVRRFRDPGVAELVGLLAASLAFGNVKSIRSSIERVLSLLGVDFLAVLEDRAATVSLLSGVRHRMVDGCDVARMLVGARRVQREYGTLGSAFYADWASNDGDMRRSLASWVERIRDKAGFGENADQGRRGPAHVLTDPMRGSGCKRLLLYLRWMVRRDDGVDVGLWDGLTPDILLMPVDTHVHRIAVNLGMTRRLMPSWRVSEDITSVLRMIDPLDPIRFDFALCHLGMSGGCPSKPDRACCDGCAARRACLAYDDVR